MLTVKPGFVDTPMTADLKKKVLFASPDRVAQDIIEAMKKKEMHRLHAVVLALDHAADQADP